MTDNAREDFARFARDVWKQVARIPRGRVATYGQIAARLGRPRHARLVGRAMRACPDGIPWHRVVNAAGKISPRGRMASMVTQQIKLEHEGVIVRRGRIALRRYRWTDRRGDDRHEAGTAPELLGRRAQDGRRQDPRGRAPRVRFDLDRGGLRL